jgi:hypothetical protein
MFLFVSILPFLINCSSFVALMMEPVKQRACRIDRLFSFLLTLKNFDQFIRFRLFTSYEHRKAEMGIIFDNWKKVHEDTGPALKEVEADVCCVSTCFDLF